MYGVTFSTNHSHKIKNPYFLILRLWLPHSRKKEFPIRKTQNDQQWYNNKCTTLNIYSFFLAVSSLDLAACVAVNVHVLFSLNTVNSNVPSIELSLHTVRVFGSSQFIVRNNYMGTMLYFEITYSMDSSQCNYHADYL